MGKNGTCPRAAVTRTVAQTHANTTTYTDARRSQSRYDVYKITRSQSESRYDEVTYDTSKPNSKAEINWLHRNEAQRKL